MSWGGGGGGTTSESHMASQPSIEGPGTGPVRTLGDFTKAASAQAAAPDPTVMEASTSDAMGGIDVGAIDASPLQLSPGGTDIGDLSFGGGTGPDAAAAAGAAAADPAPTAVDAAMAGGGGGGLGDIMALLGAGAKVGSALRSKPPGQLVNFGGASRGGFGAPTSGAFAAGGKGATLGSMAKRMGGR